MTLLECSRPSRATACGIFAITSAFALLVALPILQNWRRGCFNAWDLGIYGQELQRISHGELNPWLTVSEIRAFNDHFDPIVLLVAPLARVFEPTLAAVLAELAFYIAAAGVLFCVACRITASQRLALTFVSVLLLGSATTAALSFPAHPTSWAVLAFICLAGALALDRPSAVLLALAGLFLFKEENVFVGYALGLFFLWRRRTRLGVAALTLSLVWSLVAFALRPALCGPTAHYATSILGPWSEHPLTLVANRLSTWGTWRIWAELALPLLPTFVWLRRERVRLNTAMLAPLAPVLLTRFLSDRWNHHYGVAVVACLIGLLLPAVGARVLTPPRRVLWLTIILLAATQMSFLGHYSLRTTLRGGLRECPADPVRLQEIDRAVEIIACQRELPLFAMGNLLPRALVARNVYHLETTHTTPTTPFLVLVEGPPTGVPWPLAHDDDRRRVDEWKQTFSPVALVTGRFVRLWRFEKPHESARPGTGSD